LEETMHETPKFSATQRQRRNGRGYEPRDLGETGATLWVAAAVIILIVTGLSVFAHDRVSNGGAPFIITPSSDLTAAPAPGY
jgi:hypothetical protein